MKTFLLPCLMCFAVGGETLKIVSMKEWSGEESKRTEVLPNPVPLAVIQHTVTQECFTDEACEQLLRKIRTYFIQVGHTDMSYNFLIGGNGKVYEGAGWNLVGAHTFNYNRESIGIGFLGDFRVKLPTPEALQAAQELLNYGLENNHLDKEYKLVGHRQLSQTISPGDALQNVIQNWPHWSNVQHSN